MILDDIETNRFKMLEKAKGFTLLAIVAKAMS